MPACKPLSKSCALAALAALLWAGEGRAGAFVYVSDAEDGDIAGYALSSEGALTPLGRTTAAKLVMPMALSPDQRHLYAAVRSKPYAILTFGIEAGTGALNREGTSPAADSLPYISLDKTGRFLFGASYGGDKLSVNPVGANGIVTEGPSEVIKTGKTPHSILADRSDRFVYATNLSSQQIQQFKFDAATGRLTPNDPPTVALRPDSNPRHIVIAPDNKYLYAVSEGTGNITQFAIDASSGLLSEVGTFASVAATSPRSGAAAQDACPVPQPQAALVSPQHDEAEVKAADLHLTPDGRFMYVSERANNTISLLSVAPRTGSLIYLGSYATEKQPRGFQIDPSGQFLVAAGEKSDRLAIYKIDRQTGCLTQLGRYPVGRGANWVIITGSR